MGKLTCPCLNINIHTKGNDLQRLDPTLLGLSIDQLRAPFFERDIAEVKLDLGGVAEEQDYLIHKTKVGEWSIRSCINCDTPAYATHNIKGLGRVLVSLSLVRDEKMQEHLQSSADFSPLYRVTLKDSGAKSSSSSLVHPMTGNQDVIRKTVAQLQDHLNKYLSREKLAMEERIRRYSEEQKAGFSQLQKRAYCDKNIMVGVLLNAEEKNLEDSLSDAMLDNTLTPPTTPITRPGTVQSRMEDSFKLPSSLPASRAPIRHFTPAMPKSRPIPQQPHRSQPMSMAQSVPTHAHQRHVNRTSSDADTMFDLEGFTQDDEPFFESDESSTDDNSLNEENLSGPAMPRDQQEYAASVPISMPMWKREMHSPEDDDDEMAEKVPMPEPERMMASMRALSHSVQDGTEMFGDLPRPRLNTVGETTIVKKSGRRL